MAQPWKFHSLAVVVSSRIQGLGEGGGAGWVAADASAFASAGFASTTLAAASFASTTLESAEGAGFASSLVSPSFSPFRKNSASLPSIRPTKTRDLSSCPGKPITTGSLGPSGSQLLSYSFTYFGTGASTSPSDTSDFHSPKVNSSLRTSSSDAPLSGP